MLSFTRLSFVALFFISVFLFAACGTHVKPPKGKPGLVIGDPINYYDDSTLLFPVGCNYFPTGDNLIPFRSGNEAIGNAGAGSFVVSVSDRSSANGYTSQVKEYRNSSPDSYDMRNLLFLNKFNKHSYSLVDSGLHILAFEIHKEFIHPYVMYKVVKQDMNNDSLFTEKDIVSIYFSRPDGSRFTQLTPDGENYNCYFYYPETNSMLIKTFSDTNGDQKIAAGDESNFFEVDLKNPQMAQNIFSDSLRNALKKYIE